MNGLDVLIRSQAVAFAVVVPVCVFACLFLFSLYREKRPNEPSWLRRWRLSGEVRAEGRTFSYARFVLVSALGLFLEMLMIRWVSSEVRIFAYLKNFVLVACCLGFGLGCCLSRRRVNLLALAVPLIVLVLIVTLPVPALRLLVRSLTDHLGASSQVHIWGVPSVPLGWDRLLPMVSAIAVIVPLFALISSMFIPIGQWVGSFLEHARNGITAYSINVLASLGGIGAYTALCFMHQPPAVWLTLAGLMLLGVVWSTPRVRWGLVAIVVGCAGLLHWNGRKDASVFWSPYQKLEISPVRDDDDRILGYNLRTNDSWYQRIVDLSPGFVASHPHLFAEGPVAWDPYNVPYRFKPGPASVLVLGAGLGNDVAAALRHGAARVVAVEIDPLILQLGRQLHVERPYDSARVVAVVDDARNYVQNARERFDLIVFSLLDSHTASSHYSNIRIDNYVYTVEGLRAARRLLQPDGAFIVKFEVQTPWLAGRLFGLLEHVFAHRPLQLQSPSSYGTGGRFFVTALSPTTLAAMTSAETRDYMGRQDAFAMETATLTTDDWPYLYQHEPGLPASVIVMSLVLIVSSSWAMRATGLRVRSIRWHLFFLGAGFMLLEAQIVSRMALLFGTTWTVNSIVVALVLLLVLAANAVAAVAPRIPATLAYAGIFVTMTVSYVVPLEAAFFSSIWLKAVAATAVLCLPIFFAGVLFIQSLARDQFKGDALGSNLLGALAGGLLESLSMWTGVRALLIVAAILYGASYLCLRNEKARRADGAGGRVWT